MPKSLVSLGFLLFFLFLIPNGIYGQDIQRPEIIKVDPNANFQVTPRAFCVTEDQLFLFPDYEAGTVKILAKSGKALKFISEFGRDTMNKVPFGRPMYCFYNQKQSRLGIIDYGVRKVFFFKRNGKVEFEPIKILDCQRLGYDMEIAGDCKQLVISGYVTDKENNPFDLYSINIESEQISYLLSSPQKYDLKNKEAFESEFYKKQVLPSIGIKAFIDIEGDDLYFVWEGALRIIKLKLPSKETMIFGQQTPYYTRPVSSRLINHYLKQDLGTVEREKRTMSYVRNIFATPRHVFLIYVNGPTFRLQTYTPEGDYLGDISIMGNPGPQMWLDKENYELYALSEKSDSGEFLILKYKIKCIN